MTNPHDLRLFELPPSPNNGKVRVALGYKVLEYESVPQDPRDRRRLVERSGQPLTPVLQHGDTVIFDSGAILRYLDANLPGPSLFSPDLDVMREIERWEGHARWGVGRSLGRMYAMAFGRVELTEERVRSANETLLEHTEEAERRLGEADWLAGDAMSAADVTFASVLAYCLGIPSEGLQAPPFGPPFAEHFALPASERPAVHAWARRVLRHDRWINPGGESLDAD